MKKLLLVLFAFVLTPLMGVAQTPVEREIEQLGLKSVSFKIAASSKTPATAPAADPAAAPAASEPLMSVSFSHEDVSIRPHTLVDTNVTVYSKITNLTNEPLNIGFVRVQSLPDMWKTSVCFGTNCYVDWVDAVESAEIPWAPGESRDLVLHVRTPPGAQGTGNVALTLFPTGSTDSIRVTYTVTMQPVPVTQCRSFWFKNPYEGEVKLQDFSIANPELFDITLTSDTTYPTSQGDPFMVTFCLKNPDGQLHSTQITFVTDSGSFTRDVSMQSPVASVKPSASASSALHIVSVSPNPAVASQQLMVNLESSRSADLQISIVDILGREITSVNVTASAGSSSIDLPVNALGIGSYIVLIKEDGQIVDQTSFQVAR